MLKLRDILVTNIKIQDFWPTFLILPASIVTMHAEMAYMAVTSEEYAKEVKDSSVIIGDGFGFTLGMRILGKKVYKLSGADLVNQLVLSNINAPVYLWGGKQNIIEKASENLKNKGLNIVGFHNGYSDEKENVVLEDIRKSGAKIVLIGIGGRVKQIELVNRVYKELNIITLTVGGLFNLLAGKSIRSPMILQRIGLEWFWRMIIEPKRLRKIPLLVGFVFVVLREKING